MVESLKARSSLYYSNVGKLKAWVGTTLSTENVYPCQLSTYEQLTSSGHPWPLPKGSGGDSGGYFRYAKAGHSGLPWYGKISNGPSGGVWREYEGPIFADARVYNMTAGQFVAPSSTAVLNAVGSTMISRTLPTNPLSGMGQFLGELRDLPRIPDIRDWRNKAWNFYRGYASKRRISKAAADEYLNGVFGWLPFVKDLRDFSLAVINAEKLIAQYDRDSGRTVRRRTKPESSTETQVWDRGSSYGTPSTSGLGVSPGSLTESLVTTRTRWFSGAYTYYLPPSGSKGWSQLQRAEQLAAKLFGLRVDPILVWQLAPWSWAVDWVTNIGPVIKNWSAFTKDGLVLRYGYVMEHTKRERTYSLANARFAGGVIVNTSQTYQSETKIRLKATPYGFGLNPNSFTARQWSIIGALGISRVPGALR